MKRLFLLLLFFHASLSAKHTLTYFLTTSTGHKTIPEFVGVAMLDGVYVGYCDSNNRTEIRSDWMEEVEKHPELMEWLNQTCIENNNFNKKYLKDIQQFFDQTEGFHILQELVGCEFDDETDSCSDFDFYGYDGANFVSLDPNSMSWIYTERAEPYKHQWDTKEQQLWRSRGFIRTIFYKWLKVYLLYGKTSLQRKGPPSVFLLQKSPSSPISCFATGFYPNRADMFWRRDGERAHEDVDHGEILPNPDGTFQMRVDLDLSSVRAEDWSSYDCVFKLSGVKDGIITKLDRAGIRTNAGSSEMFVKAVVAVVLILLAVTACFGCLIFIYQNLKKYQNRTTPDVRLEQQLHSTNNEEEHSTEAPLSCPNSTNNQNNIQDEDDGGSQDNSKEKSEDLQNNFFNCLWEVCCKATGHEEKEEQF